MEAKLVILLLSGILNGPPVNFTYDKELDCSCNNPCRSEEIVEEFNWDNEINACYEIDLMG